MDPFEDHSTNIILNDIELGGDSTTKREKFSTPVKEEKNSNEDTIQKKIAGGIFSSIKNGITSTAQNMMFNLPKLGGKYFKVTTHIVKNRFIQGLKPYKNNLNEEISDFPDIYGPFWIYTTVVFCLAASGVSYQFLNGVEKGKAKTSFSDYVSVSSFWIYMIGLLFPGITTLMIKYIGGSVDYMKAYCIYGYTFSVFIPVSIVCIFFNSFVDWIILLYACLSSAYILINCFSNYISAEINIKKKYGILGTIGILQFLLVLFMSFYFFSGEAEKPITLDKKINKVEEPNLMMSKIDVKINQTSQTSQIEKLNKNEKSDKSTSKSNLNDEKSVNEMKSIVDSNIKDKETIRETSENKNLSVDHKTVEMNELNKMDSNAKEEIKIHSEDNKMSKDQLMRSSTETSENKVDEISKLPIDENNKSKDNKSRIPDENK